LVSRLGMPSRRISKLGTLVNILGMKIVSLRNGVTIAVWDNGLSQMFVPHKF
jgi:hypothetical protein